jgi:2-dehydropantoate 2-reductase
MKIAVVGTGGVGGYFGGRLATAGEDVTFIARGSHLEAMQANGLRVSSHHGDFVVHPIQATHDPSKVGPVDVVMVAVKLWDVEAVGDSIGPMLGAETGVISFQNGVDAEEMLAARVGWEHVVGGIAYITASIAGPGQIEQIGAAARLVVGEMDGRESPRVEAFAEACRHAGIDVAVSADVQKELWTKFVYICALSGVTTLTRSTIGPIMNDPDTRQLFQSCLEEVAAVARAKDVRLDSDVVQRHLAWAEGLPPGARSSMLVDLERGNRLEVPWLNGTVARLGAELGVDTPTNRFIYRALKLHASGTPTSVP